MQYFRALRPSQTDAADCSNGYRMGLPGRGSISSLVMRQTAVMTFRNEPEARVAQSQAGTRRWVPWSYYAGQAVGAAAVLLLYSTLLCSVRSIDCRINTTDLHPSTCAHRGLQLPNACPARRGTGRAYPGQSLCGTPIPAAKNLACAYPGACFVTKTTEPSSLSLSLSTLPLPSTGASQPSLLFLPPSSSAALLLEPHHIALDSSRMLSIGREGSRPLIFPAIL
ncbi:hypothetical protein CC78DRAFT_574672 [Lojkania enalia]|uniref:Uncharacterized protein n=1 Tax=Lojkania enalia TaxID=147567 RepID=A0A9P4NAW7_9PLEO|nr:hypothetical protein CC78DRAFT_574672 [Didymosphaeria enalia]